MKGISTLIGIAVLSVLTFLLTAVPTNLPRRPDPTPVFGLDVWDIPTLASAERQLSRRAGIVGMYQDWVHQPAFPTATTTAISARGAVPLIAWEPWDSWKPASSQPNFAPRLIATGRYRTHVDRWLIGAKTFGKPVLVRFAPEMNGDWNVWSPNKRTNSVTPADYIAMWRYVVSRSRQLRATNIKWVWNPIVASGETTPMTAMFPGNAYVDWTALDGFNWGSTRPWGWQSYRDIFATSVPVLRRLAPGKPWFIAEVGCAPSSGNEQALWVADTVASASRDGAKAVVWFHFDKETDWRLTSNPSTITTVKRLVSSRPVTTTSSTLR